MPPNIFTSTKITNSRKSKLSKSWRKKIHLTSCLFAHGTIQRACNETWSRSTYITNEVRVIFYNDTLLSSFKISQIQFFLFIYHTAHFSSQNSSIRWRKKYKLPFVKVKVPTVNFLRHALYSRQQYLLWCGQLKTAFTYLQKRENS